MKLRRSRRWFELFLAGALVLVAVAARAAGPLFVGGPGFVEGLPFRFDPASFPLTYWTDQGNLGNQSNTQADDLVEQAFNVWENVPTATISFSAAGELGADVSTGNEYLAVENSLNDCSTLPGPPAGGVAQNRSLIYDLNGSILEDLGIDQNSILGFASPACLASDGVNNFYYRGLALLNGRFIDGVDTVNNPEISLEEFRAVFIHEFGHMIGLDHTQINVNCLSIFGCGTDDLEGLPTMFPLLVSLEMATLAPDDIAGISALYPESNFASTTGRIQGRIFFSDSLTHAQGVNVIARRVDDPGTPGVDESRRQAVSCVSGFLYTADAGNPLVQFPGFTPSPFGSRDPALIGFYDIVGLAPGDYKVEIEAIDQSFTLGSSVGPIGTIGFQFWLPGPPEFWDAGESEGDDPAASTPITVAAGATEPDKSIIMNDTPPRLDAWEDE